MTLPAWSPDGKKLAVSRTITEGLVDSYSLEVLDPDSFLAIPFGLGAASGIVSWFAIVLLLLHRYRRRISPRLRDRLLRSMGVLLIALAVLAAARSWLPGRFF